MSDDENSAIGGYGKFLVNSNLGQIHLCRSPTSVRRELKYKLHFATLPVNRAVSRWQWTGFLFQSQNHSGQYHKLQRQSRSILFYFFIHFFSGGGGRWFVNRMSRKSLTRYSLRSSQRIMLEIPSGKILSTLGGRAFCYAAPKLWNNLPCKISSPKQMRVKTRTLTSEKCLFNQKAIS